MQKLLVMSATYHQSAAVTDQLLEKDPYIACSLEDRAFASMRRTSAIKRLPSAGCSIARSEGPALYPVQPPNLWKEVGFLRRSWEWMSGRPVKERKALYPPSLYTFWRRIVTYPSFAVFDAPSRDTCVSRRPRSNTPLQALTTLMIAFGGGSPRSRAAGPSRGRFESQHTDGLCFSGFASLSRSPTKAEQQRLIRFYQEQLRSFESDPQSAETLIAQGAARPGQVDVRRLAAWTMVANALLNLDEMLTKGSRPTFRRPTQSTDCNMGLKGYRWTPLTRKISSVSTTT